MLFKVGVDRNGNTQGNILYQGIFSDYRHGEPLQGKLRLLSLPVFASRR